MRNPTDVLNSLCQHSLNKEYKYDRVYRNLYNTEFYSLAYQNLYAKEGNMTEGVDGKTIDGMSIDRIEKIIKKLKDHSYQPNPAKRVYIPKSNGKLRPLGIPSVEDKLVQEIVRMLLESIYEPTFSKWSHGFRPNMSCHTALLQIQANFTGAKWFIEGDIKSFFDNIDHHTLVNILRERITDEYFIALIWKFLKAGYMEQQVFNRTYSGTPQGSIISPILSNIYLDKLDKFMEKYMDDFQKGKDRAPNREYFHLKDKQRWLQNQKYSKEEWHKLPEENKAEIISKIKELEEKIKNSPSVEAMDDKFKRLKYVRYADDWICGVIGSKADALKIKNDIKAFLADKLKLELSEEKTLITHGNSKARFLGFDVYASNSNDRIKKANGNTMRFFKGRIKLEAPKDKWVNKLLELGVLEIKHEKGSERFVPVHRNCMVNNDDLEILNQFNSEIRGMYNFYRIADNVSVLNDFYYIMSYSMFKTYAAKYKTHISNIRNRFGVKSFAVPYTNKDGKACRAYFYDEGFRRNKLGIKQKTIDVLPDNSKNFNKTSLMDRLKSRKCEVCEKEDVEIEIHHVRKLKDLKGKVRWEKLMIGRQRKTLAICTNCHDKLHAGKLD